VCQGCGGDEVDQANDRLAADGSRRFFMGNHVAITKDRKHLAVTLLKLFVSVGLFAFLIQKLDGSELRKSLSSADPVVFGFACLVFALITIIQSWRWHLIAKVLQLQFGLRSAVRIGFIGAFFNQILPSSVGGDAVRVYELRKCGVPLGKAFNSIAIDRIAALLSMVALVVGGVLALGDGVASTQVNLVLAELGVGAVAALALLLLLDRLPMPGYLGMLAPVKALVKIAGDARSVFLSCGIILPVTVVSLLVHIAVGVVFWMLGRQSGLGVDLTTCVVLVPLALLFTILPISLAGWGVREGVIVVAFGFAGGNTISALATSILIGAAFAVAALPGALLWLTRGEGLP
jgi:glycosyltransferase 2 family protein